MSFFIASFKTPTLILDPMQVDASMRDQYVQILQKHGVVANYLADVPSLKARPLYFNWFQEIIDDAGLFATIKDLCFENIPYYSYFLVNTAADEALEGTLLSQLISKPSFALS